MIALPDFRALQVTIEGATAEVVLRGPGKGNALGPDFWREMPIAFNALSADESVRAIVLYGANDTFTYGLDIPAMSGELRHVLDGSNGPGERMKFLDRLDAMQGATTSIMHCRKPVIAAISGWC